MQEKEGPSISHWSDVTLRGVRSFTRALLSLRRKKSLLHPTPPSLSWYGCYPCCPCVKRKVGPGRRLKGCSAHSVPLQRPGKAVRGEPASKASFVGRWMSEVVGLRKREREEADEPSYYTQKTSTTVTLLLPGNWRKEGGNQKAWGRPWDIKDRGIFSGSISAQSFQGSSGWQLCKGEVVKKRTRQDRPWWC